MNLRFENDVKMYGTQTTPTPLPLLPAFENEVKMYGTQTFATGAQAMIQFENDVKSLKIN